MKVITIGRGSDNDIIVPDGMVSRHHCQIKHDNNGCFYVVDFGSSNGTYVNGRRISGEYPLRWGDRVQVGQTVVDWQRPFTTKRDARESKSSSSTGLIVGLVVTFIIIGTVLVLALSGVFSGGDSSSAPQSDGHVTTNVPGVRPNRPSGNSSATQPMLNEKLEVRDKRDGKRIDFSGEWHWTSNNTVYENGVEVPVSMMYLNITQTENELNGFYSATYSTSITDDAEEDNVVVGIVSGNEARVSFRSEAWGGNGTAKLTFNSNNTITWSLLSQNGTSYVPDVAVLRKEN